MNSQQTSSNLPHNARPVPNPISPEQRLSVKEVAVLLSRSVSGIWAAVKSGNFPPPERYGSRCTRWRWGTVLDHLNQVRNAG
jgi:predicted DNA-binding transcriptional regulator AlpA